MKWPGRSSCRRTGRLLTVEGNGFRIDGSRDETMYYEVLLAPTD